MSGAGKIVVSGAMGGTAEALGGGKFANGAVTGAYVMMLIPPADHGKRKNRISNESILFKTNPDFVVFIASLLIVL